MKSTKLYQFFKNYASISQNSLLNRSRTKVILLLKFQIPNQNINNVFELRVQR